MKHLRDIALSAAIICGLNSAANGQNGVADILDGLVQKRVEQAHEAQTQLRYFRQLPPRPPRPLTGYCAGYTRDHSRL
jgi:hypothetical protein